MLAGPTIHDTHAPRGALRGAPLDLAPAAAGVSFAARMRLRRGLARVAAAGPGQGVYGRRQAPVATLPGAPGISCVAVSWRDPCDSRLLPS